MMPESWVDPDTAGAITRAVAALRRGDRTALDALFAHVYPELRSMAHRHVVRSVPDGVLNTTALVHEVYLKFARARLIDAADRRHFLAVAGRAMRQILVDHARSIAARKRHVASGRLALDPRTGPDPQRADELIALDAALVELETLSPRLSQTVELRFFAGLSTEETAEVLHVSSRTVKRDWQKARAFLIRSMQQRPASRPGRDQGAVPA